MGSAYGDVPYTVCFASEEGEVSTRVYAANADEKIGEKNYPDFYRDSPFFP